MTAFTTTTQFANLDVDGKSIRLEYQWVAPDQTDRPLMVFLHEGLGSIAMWKDWPQRLCTASGCRGLVFSRYGYGFSTERPKDEKWPITYLHDQARSVVPALFEQLSIDTAAKPPILFGHSDGATIALLYAAAFPGKTTGIIVAAPHIFVEDVTVQGIEQARQAYLNTDMREKLQRYHSNPDSAFWAWNDAWLNPSFRGWNIESQIEAIACPVLALQGVDDEYATLEQIHGIKKRVPQTLTLAIPGCGHSPHKDQPAIVTQAVIDFLAARGAETS
jgi:pimeloyl-ACP methyl ester carboxylesterase